MVVFPVSVNKIFESSLQVQLRRSAVFDPTLKHLEDHLHHVLWLFLLSLRSLGVGWGLLLFRIFWFLDLNLRRMVRSMLIGSFGASEWVDDFDYSVQILHFCDFNNRFSRDSSDMILNLQIGKNVVSSLYLPPVLMSNRVIKPLIVLSQGKRLRFLLLEDFHDIAISLFHHFFFFFYNSCLSKESTNQIL